MRLLSRRDGTVAGRHRLCAKLQFFFVCIKGKLSNQDIEKIPSKINRHLTVYMLMTSSVFKGSN